MNEAALGLRSELQKNEDVHNRNMRDEMERFERSRQEHEQAILAARREIEQKEYELKRREDEYNRLNKEY